MYMSSQSVEKVALTLFRHRRMIQGFQFDNKDAEAIRNARTYDSNDKDTEADDPALAVLE